MADTFRKALITGGAGFIGSHIAEALVTLDSQPGKVFGIRHHEEVAATENIIDTLREAYLHNLPVTIEHGIAPGKNNLKIIWVQLGEAK